MPNFEGRVSYPNVRRPGRGYEDTEQQYTDQQRKSVLDRNIRQRKSPGSHSRLIGRDILLFEGQLSFAGLKKLCGEIRETTRSILKEEEGRRYRPQSRRPPHDAGVPPTGRSAFFFRYLTRPAILTRKANLLSGT
jgi:hypothetical protein